MNKLFGKFLGRQAMPTDPYVSLLHEYMTLSMSYVWPYMAISVGFR